MSIWFNASFKAWASLLLFCLDDLSIYVWGALKFFTIIVLLPISAFKSNICLIYQGAPVLGAYIFTVVISSSWINPLIFMESPLSLVCACLLSHFSHVWLFVLQSCLTLCSSVQGILQARTLEWIAMLSSKESSPPRDWTCISYVSCIGRQGLYH